MNSNPPDSTQQTPITQLGSLNIQLSPSSNAVSPSFADDPLDSLLDKLVHEMTDTELVDYVKRCAVLRSSAQTRKAQVRSEGPAKKTVKKDDSVAKAEALLKQLLG